MLGTISISAVAGASGGLLFAKSGIKATLADKSAALDFSSWRFFKRGLSARHIDLKECALPENSFDFITAMDVFEHPGTRPERGRPTISGRRSGREGFCSAASTLRLMKPAPPYHSRFRPHTRSVGVAGFSRVWQDRWLWGHEVFQT